MGSDGMGMVVERFEVFLISLDPTVGREIQKTRPCVVISPDEMNRSLSTVIIAPMTSKGRLYPTRVNCHFQDKAGQIVLDQIRTVDKSRLLKKLGQLEASEQEAVLGALAELFAK
jgi:mRNA interferase MazF